MTAPYPAEIVSGDQYTSVEEARRAALHPIAQAVAQAIREGLSTGRLVIINGIVIPAGLDNPHKGGV